VQRIHPTTQEVIGVLARVTHLGTAHFIDKIIDHHYGNSGSYLLNAPQHRLIVTATDKNRTLQARTQRPATGARKLSVNLKQTDLAPLFDSAQVTPRSQSGDEVVLT
jgi:hypothetical protein